MGQLLVFPPMAVNPTQRDYNEAFCARVAALRAKRGLSQKGMANLLQIGLEAYKKYEKRTPLPHFLIYRFVHLVGEDLEFLISGERTPKQRAKPLGTGQVEHIDKDKR